MIIISKNNYIFKKDFIILKIYSKKLKETVDVYIDYEDANLLFYNWYIKITEKGYKKVCSRINGKDRSLSNMIIGKKKDYVVDHIDRNPFNNRRNNLRLVSQSINNKNRKFKNNKLGFTGVIDRGNSYCVSWYEKGKRKYKTFSKSKFKNDKQALKAAIRFRYFKGLENDYTFSKEEKEMCKIKIQINKKK